MRTGITNKVTFDYPIQGPNYSYSFHAAWRNGKAQVLEPISLDLVNATHIVDKAAAWSGKLYNLARGADFSFTGVIAPPSDPTLGRAFDRAMAILRQAPNVRSVVLERQSETLLETIRHDVEHQSGPSPESA